MPLTAYISQSFAFFYISVLECIPSTVKQIYQDSKDCYNYKFSEHYFIISMHEGFDLSRRKTVSSDFSEQLINISFRFRSCALFIRCDAPVAASKKGGNLVTGSGAVILWGANSKSSFRPSFQAIPASSAIKKAVRPSLSSWCAALASSFSKF